MNIEKDTHQAHEAKEELQSNNVQPHQINEITDHIERF
tara:strand:- start:130 stop:243 length:114 start_codon:yes stop_codon:yes gene_type:complete